jgi:hypothetical protein
LGGALIGAGIGGLTYEMQAAARGQQFSWAGWGLAEGIGAVTGLGLGVLSAIAGAVEGGAAGLAGDAGELSESAEASFSKSTEASEDDVFIGPSTEADPRLTDSFPRQDDLLPEYDRFKTMGFPRETMRQIFNEWSRAEIPNGGIFNPRVSEVSQFLETFYGVGPDVPSFDEMAAAARADDDREFEAWFATEPPELFQN